MTPERSEPGGRSPRHQQSARRLGSSSSPTRSSAAFRFVTAGKAVGAGSFRLEGGVMRRLALSIVVVSALLAAGAVAALATPGSSGQAATQQAAGAAKGSVGMRL